MQHANARVQQTIRKVEKGEFDSVLKKLEGSPLGIYANACVVEGEVVPMPAGYMQSENALEISVTNKKDTDAIQVSWMGWHPLQTKNGSAISREHDQPGSCVREPHSRRPGRTLQSIGAQCEHINYPESVGARCEHINYPESVGARCEHINYPESVGARCIRVGTDHGFKGAARLLPPELGHRERTDGAPLHAREIDPVAIAQSVEGHADLLASLAMDGLGIFMVHGHTEDVEFVELPAGFMSVIENNKTSFRERESVLNNQRFVPNVWRFENGVRQPVGGFVV